jgi:hypothetical protein
VTTLSASKARIPPDAFNRVAYQGERVRIRHRDGANVVLISEEDVRLLEALEDRYWAEIADEAISAMERTGQKPIRLRQAKKKLGR